MTNYFFSKTNIAAKAIFCLVILATLSFSEVNAQKFAFVDSKYILSHVPEYQQAQTEINKLSKQWQKEIESKYETIERLEKSFQAEKILLTEEMRKKREEEMEQKRTEAKELQKKKFGVDGELFKKREELIKPIQDRIYEAIQEVATAGSYMVVFDKANHSNMLYTNPKQDASDKVLKKMGLKPGEILEEDEKTEGGEGEEKPQEEKPQDKGKGDTKSPTPGRKGK